MHGVDKAGEPVTRHGGINTDPTPPSRSGRLDTRARGHGQSERPDHSLAAIHEITEGRNKRIKAFC